MGTESLEGVYEALHDVMTSHATGLRMVDDRPGNLTVESSDTDAKGKPRWFGAVQIKKNYVSYHLMPVYENPQLLDGLTPELKARMQGKSCFNFKAIDEDLFAQLAELTALGAQEFGLAE